ncbi:MAG: PD-(D/E)XK nuclease family protein, partial [Candidatus Gastranaerophilales bacterium]|nr:PD-(D/E)XK nuclease family protein [Candidatus Gastranaerophilales bacterium]
LISAYLKNFDIEKLELALESEDLAVWKIHKNSEIMQTIKNAGKKFIEQPFFIKETCLMPPFYLSGRLDAVIYHEGKYIIFDWKTENLPKNPEDDIQTVVYMYCVSKLFKTKNIQMKYCSIKEQKTVTCGFSDNLPDKICSIIKKHN